MNYVLILQVMLGALIVADAITTVLALRHAGLREGNPILRWLMERVGTVAAVVLSHVAMLLVVSVITAWWVLVLACAFYAWVVLNNILLLRAQRP